MKLQTIGLICALMGSVAIIGCGDNPPPPAATGGTGGNGTGGTGGNGTGGTGGNGLLMCEATAQEVCMGCDVQDQVAACESRFDACRADPPDIINPCEACAVLALEECEL